LTASGKTCIPWIQSSLTYPYSELMENYCRNPSQWRDVPWCFTDEDNVEECDIPECELKG